MTFAGKRQRLARRLCKVVDTISLNDSRKPKTDRWFIASETGLDPLLEGPMEGAARSVQSNGYRWSGMLSATACKHPALLYAGNQQLAEEIKDSLGPLTIFIIDQSEPPSRDRDRRPPACPNCPCRAIHPHTSQPDERCG